MTTVDVAPELLDWAIARGATTPASLRRNFPRLEGWRRGETSPTLRQLEEFARATNTPVGYLFLDEPPEEQIPLADFRVRGPRAAERRSADLLDQIYLVEQRQAWYADYARDLGLPQVSFVNSMTLDVQPVVAADTIREHLDLPPVLGRTVRTWAEALSALAERIEALGALVMISGVVASNTHRPLDPEEFSGFSLSDDLAPVIFVNGADTKAAQVFTIVHELAHLYLGDSALSKVEPGVMGAQAHEDWCNRVAVELLVSEPTFRAEVPRIGRFPEQLDDLALTFKVSTLVVLRRMFELKMISRPAFFAAYEDERARLASLPRPQKRPGGTFDTTAPVRASKRFTRSLVQSTLEGRTLYRDAFALIGTHKSASLQRLGQRLGVA